MSDLRELYQAVILDHNKRPRNFGTLDEATHEAHGHNPLCGDMIRLQLSLDDADVVQGIAFDGEGCAISKASASVMTETLKGRDRTDAEALFQRFHDLVTGKGGDTDALGKLAVFAGVSEFPIRVKCATLAWHTLRAALADATTPVSTE